MVNCAEPYKSELEKVVRKITQKELNDIVQHLDKAEAFRSALQVAANNDDIGDMGVENVSILLEEIYNEVDEAKALIQGDAKVRTFSDMVEEKIPTLPLEQKMGAKAKHEKA